MKYAALLALIFLPLLALAQATDTSFVPLTNIPVLFEAGNAISTPEGLSLFLNTIYKISIGVAAVVAVLQIMRAGIMYMGSESGFAEKKEAKNLIALSIGGLILVLAPTIVFSIINPDILTLKIKGIDALKTETRVLSDEAKAATLWTDSTSTRAAAKAKCTADGGTAVFTCTPKPSNGNDGRVVPEGEVCNAATETSSTVCRKNETTPATSCNVYPESERAASSNGVCDGSQGYTQIEASCCKAALGQGAVCCGRTSAPKPVTYGWRGRAQAVTPNDTGAFSTVQQGPFNTKALCEASVTSYAQDNNVAYTGEFECTCNKPLSEQPACSTIQ